MKDIFIKLLVSLALIVGVASARAAVIAPEAVGTTEDTDPAADYGEFLQTPLDFLYNNSAFNFYFDVPAATPVSTGTAFLLSMPYTGTPTGLSLRASGFLTESARLIAFAPLGAAGSFSPTGTLVGVPLPEPSSQTAVYVLSGVIGLGFVVMRRRGTVA